MVGDDDSGDYKLGLDITVQGYVAAGTPRLTQGKHCIVQPTRQFERYRAVQRSRWCRIRPYTILLSTVNGILKVTDL